jgi:drug/metabolite transporter (DMT)-like permease
MLMLLICSLIDNFPQYLLPFLVNQAGSLLYVYALQRNHLSIAVLVTNSLTLLITSITSVIVEKKPISYRTYIGALLISLGSSLCVISSQSWK